VFRSVFLGIITDPQEQESTFRFRSVSRVAFSNPHGDGSGTTSDHMKSGLPLTSTSDVGVKVNTRMASADEHTVREQELTAVDMQQDNSNSV